MSEPVRAKTLETKALTKDYRTGVRGGSLRALDGLDLEVAPGEVFGLLGPNGSGKSTAMKLLLGLINPTSGSCSIAGFPSASLEARRRVGYLPEMPDFYRHLSGRELVSFYGRLSGIPRAELPERVRETIDWVGLGEAADRLVGTFSKGMLQRIGLAQAIVHDPPVILLDEPTAGVDPLGAAAMGALIRKLRARGKTVLISSHLLAHVEELCDRIAILHRGRKIAEGSIEQVTRAPVPVPVWRIEGLTAESADEVRAWLSDRGWRLTVDTNAGVSLEEVFCRLVTENERENAS